MALPIQARRLRIAWLSPLLLAGALAGCDRGADTGATANPTAPGRPGGSQTVDAGRPVPGSIHESPQVGGSTARVPVGITGSGGTTDVPGEMASRSPLPKQPGTGVDGGLNDGPAAGAEAASQKMGAGPAAGSPNRTSGNAVGQR